MPDTNRIRISLSASELEVEGSEEFINRYEKSLAALIKRVVEETPAPTLAPQPGSSGSVATPGPASTSKSSFGELLQAMPKGATGTDQILVAGYFVGLSNTEKTFGTNEANRLLIEQGVKLSNPSQSLRNNLTAKRVFKVGSRFRVSKTGEQHLEALVGGTI